MRGGIMRLVGIVLTLLLAGCATNKLRTDYAGLVASRGETASKDAEIFLAEVESARREANLDLFAADPACALSEAYLRAVPLATAPGPGTICIPEGQSRTTDDKRISLRPLTADLRSTVALIDALASYSDALAQIVETVPADPARQFRDALVSAKAVQDVFGAIFKQKPGPIPAADDPRVKALADFVGFLGELAAEQDKVDRLRALLGNPQTIGAGAIIEALRGNLKIWESSRQGDEALRLGFVAAQVNRVRDVKPPASAGERRAALSAYNARLDATAASDRLYPALDHLLLTVAETDADLRRVLRENPDLTPRERARVAEIARQRLVRALNNVTAIITSFRKA